MRLFEVCTANGDWVVYAADKEAAKRQVYYITLGRCGAIGAVREVCA